jgi:hypothetical protein
VSFDCLGLFCPSHITAHFHLLFESERSGAGRTTMSRKGHSGSYRDRQFEGDDSNRLRRRVTDSSVSSIPEARRQSQASLYGADDLFTDFGSDHFEDPLGIQEKLKPPPPASGESKPGAHFCMSHDEVSSKIAAFENPAKEAKIEIMPGVLARLRGAKETWKCVENDFYLPVTCFSCTTGLCCIMDANYVLCPLCRVISPLEGCATDQNGGVGLGFTVDDLRQWQYEILLRRQRPGGL